MKVLIHIQNNIYKLLLNKSLVNKVYKNILFSNIIFYYQKKISMTFYNTNLHDFKKYFNAIIWKQYMESIKLIFK
jgi:hypothetical protein